MKKSLNQKERKNSSDSKPLGMCFVNAYHALMGDSNPNLRLVHGIVTGTKGDVKGKQYLHAWIENIDSHLVFDTSIDPEDPTVAPDFVYYVLGRIDAKKVVKYTLEETLVEASKNGTYGPWDPSFASF